MTSVSVMCGRVAVPSSSCSPDGGSWDETSSHAPVIRMEVSSYRAVRVRCVSGIWLSRTLSMSYAASTHSTSHLSGASRCSVSTCGVRSEAKSAWSSCGASDAPASLKRGSSATTYR